MHIQHSKSNHKRQIRKRKRLPRKRIPPTHPIRQILRMPCIMGDRWAMAAPQAQGIELLIPCWRQLSDGAEKKKHNRRTKEKEKKSHKRGITSRAMDNCNNF